jgi:vacuolar-type H+-ATPase subunit D/Vma8
MKATEILNNVKDLLNLSKEELKVEDIAVEESVELSTEEVTEEVKEEVEEVVLAEEPAEEVVIEEEVESPSMSYATSEELSAVKAELLSMIKALIEDKPMGDVKDIPEELSKQEEVELSEDVEEVVHSPENSIETKKNLLSNLNQPMTTEQRVNRMLFN